MMKSSGCVLDDQILEIAANVVASGGDELHMPIDCSRIVALERTGTLVPMVCFRSALSRSSGLSSGL